jgi:hypothetical protein
MNTPDLLDAAADLIEERGHYIGGDHTTASGECVITACMRVDVDNSFLATAAMRKFLGIDMALAAWNDTHDQAYVVLNMRKCAENLR